MEWEAWLAAPLIWPMLLVAFASGVVTAYGYARYARCRRKRRRRAGPVQSCTPVDAVMCEDVPAPPDTPVVIVLDGEQPPRPPQVFRA